MGASGPDSTSADPTGWPTQPNGRTGLPPPTASSRYSRPLPGCLAHLPINRTGVGWILHPFTHFHHTPPLYSLALSFSWISCSRLKWPTPSPNCCWILIIGGSTSVRISFSLLICHRVACVVCCAPLVGPPVCPEGDSLPSFARRGKHILPLWSHTKPNVDEAWRTKGRTPYATSQRSVRRWRPLHRLEGQTRETSLHHPQGSSLLQHEGIWPVPSGKDRYGLRVRFHLVSSWLGRFCPSSGDRIKAYYHPVSQHSSRGCIWYFILISWSSISGFMEGS
jgi:hypothetical protein